MQHVNHFWQAVSSLNSLNGTGPRFSDLPKGVKSGLLAKTNAASERGLSVNACIVTEERTLLGERTIVGLRMVKDAVKFHYPEKCITEKIPLTHGLLTAVRFAHMHYKKQLGKEEGEKKKRRAEQMESEKREQEKLRQETTLLKEKRASA